MPKPKNPENGASFDIDAIAQELRTAAAYERDGHTARTLVRTADLRVLLIAVRTGGGLSEHQADATASVHTISGHVRLKLPDRVADLPAGHIIVLERGLKHDVEAVTDSVFLLTHGWHSTP